MIKMILLYVLLLITISTYSIYSQNYGEWVSIDSTIEPRSLSASVLLPDSNVLVTGGEGNGTYIKSCEIYNVVENRWQETSPMLYARANHKMVLLNTNKVLVVGGNIEQCELFDPVTKTWSLTGSVHQKRFSGFNLIKLSDGRVLLVGGFYYSNNTSQTNYPRECEIYNPDTGKWEIADSLYEGRDEAAATKLFNGAVLITGGVNHGTVLRTCELYEPNINKWNIVDSMNIPRYEQAAILLPDSNVMETGGMNDIDPMNPYLNSCEIFKPNKNTWTIVTPMYYRRNNHSGFLIEKNLILFAGGQYKSNTWEIYDIKKMQPVYISAYPVNKFDQVFQILSNGNILSIGGQESITDQLGDPILFYSKKCEIFNKNLTFIKTIKNNSVVRKYQLFQNYPNPFNPSTVISWRTGRSEFLTLKIYDLLGRQVETLLDNKYYNPGMHKVTFNADRLPSGIYFYRIITKDFSATKKMMLVR